MKTGIALAIVHWVAVAVWGFWGWAGFWAAVAAAVIIIERKQDAHMKKSEVAK